MIGSAGAGRFSATARADYAEAIAVTAATTGHDNAIYELAGDAAYSYADMAAEVSRQTGVPADPLALERVKPTPPQVGLSKIQRAANMQGAFRAPDEARPRLEGRRVVFVDDVLTSGATGNAAARALLRAGAASVDVLVFARVVVAG
jgi:uncharacterized protein YbjT (DUF2867 family)